MKKTIILFCLIVTSLFFYGTTNAFTHYLRTKTYTVKATVKKLYRTERKIMLDHEKINGYMDAMVMTFPVSDSILLDKVPIGSRGLFLLTVENGFPKVTGAKPIASNQTYYCPMHPSKTSDKPGKCSVCGMDFIKHK
ncbi:MAG TPA: heavy metal-binding domain-containing protein [Candidatus Kapabacteria bacterium]|nr:heavy metal-binding domain-containing protein [Candidatus Kapabacteria bacterium]